MKKDFIKLNKLATVVMMATPVLSLLNGTTVFADTIVNPAGTGKDGTLTSARVIGENAQSMQVPSDSGTYTPGSAGASGTPGVGKSTGAIEFYAGSYRSMQYLILILELIHCKRHLIIICFQRHLF